MTTKNSYPFKFTGTGSEYFRIWIVNMLLTLLTLGIYSAWAKVRTKRWFYAHTQVDEQAFTYLAQPMQLLKGHLIAWAAVVVYALTAHFMPTVAPILLLVLVLVSPWLLVAGLRFNARMSAYRGIRFDFTGSVSEAYKVYLLWPLLLPFTLGLILPYLAYRQVRYFMGHTHYGDIRGEYQGSVKAFWKVYLSALGIMLAVLVVIGGGGYLVFKGNPSLLGILGSAILLSFYVLMLTVGAYLMARIGNLTFNYSALGPIGFESRLSARRLIWIFVSNLFLMVMTLGLYYPWARVRMTRYRITQLHLLSDEALDTFTGSQPLAVGATGSELADAFDLSAGVL